MEVERAGEGLVDMLTLGLTDIENCFHRFKFGTEGLGSALAEYFGLPVVTAGELQISLLDGEAISSETVLYPLATSLPMGWAWSLYFAQESNSARMCSIPSLRSFRVMSDRGEAVVFPVVDQAPPPASEPARPVLSAGCIPPFFVFDRGL